MKIYTIIKNWIKGFFWVKRSSKGIQEFYEELKRKSKSDIVRSIVSLSENIQGNGAGVSKKYFRELKSFSKKRLLKTACTLKVISSRDLKRRLRRKIRIQNLKSLVGLKNDTKEKIGAIN
jgi:hypothetical protein